MRRGVAPRPERLPEAIAAARDLDDGGVVGQRIVLMRDARMRGCYNPAR